MDQLKQALESVRIGQGLEDPDLGPVISSKQQGRVEALIQAAMAAGLDVWQETSFRRGRGHFVPPTLVNGVGFENFLFQQEIFGPVACVTPFDTEDEAIQLANATEYGLVAAVWSCDVAQAHRVAHRIKAGQVFINSYGAGGGVEMPFGGYRHSGYGREKGIEALYAYTQLKNVAIYLGDESE